MRISWWVTERLRQKVVLCFTPNDVNGFEKSELREEDTTFFVKGKFFDDSSNDEYMMKADTLLLKMIMELQLLSWS